MSAQDSPGQRHPHSVGFEKMILPLHHPFVQSSYLWFLNFSHRSACSFSRMRSALRSASNSCPSRTMACFLRHLLIHPNIFSSPATPRFHGETGQNEIPAGRLRASGGDENGTVGATRTAPPIHRPLRQTDDHFDRSPCLSLATRTGFEPVISGLTGQCVKPLHHRAVFQL